MNLLANFKEYIQRENLFQATDRLLLAVSGGVDSVVLCALCRQAGFDFEMAHCNFQLRGTDSQRDEDFVKGLAAQYGVRLHVKKFDTAAYAAAEKKSIEEAARDLRYQWFYQLLQGNTEHQPAGTYILTAHHADDNIETVLMNFFRGTGIAGLRGMLPKQSKIVRPLLFARRTELEEFVQVNQLLFVTDHTNQENIYTRNFFRNKIIPLISEAYPGAAGNVFKNIQRFRDAALLYDQSIEIHKKKLMETRGNEIHIPVLKLKKTHALPTVLYEIIRLFGFTAHQTDEAVSLLTSETGKYIQSASHRIIKNRQWLIISPRQTTVADHILIEAGDRSVHFQNGVILLEQFINTAFKISNDQSMAQVDLALIQFPLLLRRWKQGDYFYPLGMQKKKKLSRFFSDQKLSLTQKENSWVIEMNKKIIWVVGMRIDDRFKVSATTTNILQIRLSQNAGSPVPAK